MRFFYSLFIQFYSGSIKLAAFFSKKAKLWCGGRKNAFLFLQEKCAGKEQVIWFHCASLGEFEQGKPLMEKIKKQNNNVTLLVTFFSPSGYEVKKNDTIADIICYLPLDSLKNAKKFIKIVKPQQVFFVKYEYWYNYMQELSKNNIPFYYISAIFRKNQYFFKWYGIWFLKQLQKCNHFFVQNENSANLLKQHGIVNVSITGDTRFDRVYAIAQQPYELDFISSFKNGKKLLVAGSTWQPDEQLLTNLFPKINNNYKIVIVPHEITKSRISHLKKIFSSFSIVCYSEKEIKDFSDYEILIIDTIGLLSKIYKYAEIAYIGGAFKTGLHNILEAAVFEKPIFFGPHYNKFKEAVELVEKNAAFSIINDLDMAEKIIYFEENPDSHTTVCEICKNYVSQNLGATSKILSEL
jgi:3-deoxy-D-manno-octulosonic-acid transferase